MLSMNSSNETADSDPDHFGTNEIRDKSLCTVGVPMDNRSIDLVIFALDSNTRLETRFLHRAYFLFTVKI